ncbi:MAG TPA: hypothetical protein VIK91_07415, partial [Nannocystis sp.]
TTSTTDAPDTTTTTTGVIENCAQWQAAFDAEVQEIRGCTDDAECGQVLKGTSCGCTRDWVARLDADPTEFWSLAELGNQLGCNVPFISPCDCPNAEGFACLGGICSWNYL